jgi:hypothetical protein
MFYLTLPGLARRSRGQGMGCGAFGLPTGVHVVSLAPKRAMGRATLAQVASKGGLCYQGSPAGSTLSRVLDCQIALGRLAQDNLN